MNGDLVAAIVLIGSVTLFVTIVVAWLNGALDRRARDARRRNPRTRR